MAAADSFKRVSAEKPSFTISTLRNAIPAHCWERSVVKSFAYLGVDCFLMAAMYIACTHIDSAPVPSWFKWLVLWPAYWFCQGNVMWGVWVIGHECGHQAFSKYGWLNDTVGLLLHTAFLTPYFSWKISHRRHHSNCNNLSNEEAFVPSSRPAPADDHHFEVGQLAVVRLAKIVVSLLIGWPLYLLFNLSGRSYGRYVNHFDPYAPVFSKSERPYVMLTDAAFAGACYLVAMAGNTWGWGWVAKSYGAPLVVLYIWLVLVTLLHHTHPGLPRYADAEWDWLRGALGTVDRYYGPLTHVHHRIGDTHVLHHIFSTIPHYHALEASEAIKPILGDHYKYDGRSNLLGVLWEDWRRTRYVAPDTPGSGVLWFRK